MGSRFGAQARAFFGFSDGERQVSRVLATLPETYLVFDDYRPLHADGTPLGWKVDHVVVCPTGVFVIDSRHCGSARLTSSKPTSEAYAAQLATCQCRAGVETLLRPMSSVPTPTPHVVALVVCAELAETGAPPRVAGPARCIPLSQLRHALTVEQPSSALTGAILAEGARSLFLRVSAADRRRYGRAYAKFTSLIQTPGSLAESSVPALPSIHSI